MANNKKLSSQDVGQLKAKYEMGLPVREIADEMDISPTTVINNAKKNGWRHGSNKANIERRVEEDTQAIVIAKNVERSAQETEKFMQDTERIRALTLSIIARIIQTRDPANNQMVFNEEDGELYFQYLKISKIAMETINLAYMGKRKALRMDDQATDDIKVLPWED
tara:strand:+ start:430 stop:927 length:498 start_codon:yes stop_codon:yes gene_type:complete